MRTLKRVVLRYLPIFFILLTILVGRPSALWAKQDELAIDTKPYPAEKTYGDLPSALQDLEAVSVADAKTFSEDIFALVRGLMKLAEEKSAKLAPEVFNQLTIEGKIVYKDQNGRAELNMVDGELFYRVVMATESNLSFPFHWAANIHPESLHNHRYRASQHLAAGKSRKDGKAGRNVLELWIDKHPTEAGEFTVKAVKFFPCYNSETAEWFRDQKLVTLYWPTVSNVILSGFLWGGIQYHWVNILTSINHHAFNAHPPTQAQALFTFFFGALCGSFSTFLRKFNQIGTGREMIIRNIISTGLPFYLIFTALDPEKGPQYFLLWTTYVWMPLFFIMNNLTKIEIQKLIRHWTDDQRVFARADSGSSDQRKFFEVFPLPDKVLGVKTQDWVYQGFMNFLQMPLRLGDLIDLLRVRIDMLNAVIPGGKILFLSAYVPMIFSNVAVREHNHSEDAIKFREEWERSIFGLTAGLPVGTVVDSARWIFDQWLSQDLEGYYKAPDRMRNRWELQKHAPAYHAGRLLESIANTISTEPEAPPPPPAYKFARIGLTWDERNPRKPGTIGKTFAATAKVVGWAARGGKNYIDNLTLGGLTACSKGLATLAQSMKQPFENGIRQLIDRKKAEAAAARARKESQ